MSDRVDRSVRWIESIAEGVNRAAWVMSAVFLAVMLGLVFIQIGGRYVLHDAPSWTEEAARYAMIWSGLLGGVAAFHQGADPVLVQITDRHPLWLRRAQAWARTACVAAFTGVLLAHSAGFVSRAAARETEALGWNLALVVAIVPLFAALTVLLAFLKLVVFELTATQTAPRRDEHVSRH